MQRFHTAKLLLASQLSNIVTFARERRPAPRIQGDVSWLVVRVQMVFPVAEARITRRPRVTTANRVQIPTAAVAAVGRA